MQRKQKKPYNEKSKKGGVSILEFGWTHSIGRGMGDDTWTTGTNRRTVDDSKRPVSMRHSSNSRITIISYHAMG